MTHAIHKLFYKLSVHIYFGFRFKTIKIKINHSIVFQDVLLSKLHKFSHFLLKNIILRQKLPPHYQKPFPNLENLENYDYLDNLKFSSYNCYI